jgi:hypothetical protein
VVCNKHRYLHVHPQVNSGCIDGMVIDHLFEPKSIHQQARERRDYHVQTTYQSYLNKLYQLANLVFHEHIEDYCDCVRVTIDENTISTQISPRMESRTEHWFKSKLIYGENTFSHTPQTPQTPLGGESGNGEALPRYYLKMFRWRQQT